ncbi:ImpD family protein [Kluyvera ascorbata ATCC 33433]|nr:ImpD family protein [Kluyvera ascorbata ATCC 33433]
MIGTGRKMKTAELKFYKINNAGQEEEYFNILLQYARITSIVPYMEDVKDMDYAQHGHIELVEMSYEKITWKYCDGNIIHSDSWNERSAA